MAQIGKFTVVKYDNNSDALQTISNHVMEISGVPKTHDEVESSGFGQDHNFTLAQGDAPVTMTVKFNTTTHGLFLHPTTGSVGSNTARTLQVEYGNNAAPTTGDPKVSAEYVCSSAVPATAKDGLQTIVVKLALGPDAAMPVWSTV